LKVTGAARTGKANSRQETARKEKTMSRMTQKASYHGHALRALPGRVLDFETLKSYIRTLYG
jgi:hypothetical protein